MYNNFFFHTIKPKETLVSISKKYNIPVEEIKYINNLKINTIYVDRVLLLPRNDIIKDNYIYDDYSKKKSKLMSIIHKISFGETLFSVSRLYNVSVNNIKLLNDIKTNKVFKNQELIIPIEYIIHLIKESESIYSIGYVYKVSASILRKINHLDSCLTYINQELIIPLID